MPNTTSINLSQRLAKLGIDAPSEWYWFEDFCEAHKSLRPAPYIATEKNNECDIVISSAYTTDELLELLPAEMPGDTSSQLSIFKFDAGKLVTWIVRYQHDEEQTVIKAFNNPSLPECCGLMLAYLKENKII